MARQEEGLIGRLVGGMIRRSVRSRLRAVYWQPPPQLHPPVLFVCNHHGWFDGYLMYLVVKRLGLRSLMWVEELSAFPLFERVGAMPFPKDMPGRRAVTIKKTLRLIRTEARSLVLFPEGQLHPAPEVLHARRAVALLSDRVPELLVVPVAIRYEMGLHERPEAFITFGDPVAHGPEILTSVREAMKTTLARQPRSVTEYELLFEGAADVNERWDARARFGRKR